MLWSDLVRSERASRHRWWGVAAVVLATVAAPSLYSKPVCAQAPNVAQGHVLKLDSGDVIVDLAAKRGARVGDTVELWRPLSLRHPVTGRRVADRFRIGLLRLTQVRDALAIAQPVGTPSRPPAPGDIVILRRKRPSPPSRKLPTVTGSQVGRAPAAPAPGSSSADDKADSRTFTALDPEAETVAQIFDALRNADVPKRIAAYEHYVRQRQDGRFAVVLWEEAQQLRRLLTLQERYGGARAIAKQEFKAPSTALEGVSIELGIELAGPATGAVLHSRHSGEVAYTSTPMSSAGPGYWVAAVPAARMRSPRLEYFIEATDRRGHAQAVLASADDPETLRVHAIPTPRAPARPEGTVSVLSDFADYNRMKGNDRTWQTEGFVGMRFGDTGLRALRTGFGVYRGVGGSLEDLDELDKSARRVGLTYGYLETELAFSSFTALVLRGVIGLKDKGVDGGAQALVRLGNDKETNLMVGGEVLGGIGIRGITQLELNTFQRLPILFRTEVTNQPAGTSVAKGEVRPKRPGALPQDTSTERGEVGARAIAQVGYELLPGFVVAVRGSYQGRTIKHAGPGFGGAVSYTW